MPRVTIDQHAIDVPAGSTVLQAAAQLGLEIPTLCHLEGYRPSTSCLVCLVKTGGRVLPACGTPVSEGMIVESETEEVHRLRRNALELLLSDHVGDCLAPCHFACPAHMDVPSMLRAIQTKDYRGALMTVKEDIALPAVLGHVCPKPCEKGCRRNAADGPVAVCQLKRMVAEMDLSSGQPYLPAPPPATGKRVAIIGGGPTGLSAAFFLVRHGHACTLFDDQPAPGGRLRHEFTGEQLPAEVLDAEIEALLAVGVELQRGARIAEAAAFDQLRQQYDAVLIAAGSGAKDQNATWRVEAGPKGLVVDRETFATNLPGVFAAGNAIRAKGLVVRSAADGKEAAVAIDQFLGNRPLHGVVRPYSVKMGRLESPEMDEFLAQSGTAPRREPGAGIDGEFSEDDACQQAGRCLHCDCRALDSCRLRRYAEQYGADPNRYPSPRRKFQQIAQPSGVVYEPAKCIDCGLCVQIAELAGEPLGLAFVGRGFDVRIGVPFDRTLDEALTKVAKQVVEACPTAALAFASAKQLRVLGQ